MLLTVVAVINPFTFDLVHTIRYSGEALARDLSWVIIYVYGGVLLGLIVAEFLVRWWWARRKQRSGA